MNQLHVFDYNGIQVADSREVAAMLEKQHKNLLRDITGYIKAMEKCTELKIEPSAFFIESQYQDHSGRKLPCFLCTKMGCDMVANKMTGEKGVIFTAAYVSAFEQMAHKLCFKTSQTILPEHAAGVASLIRATLAPLVRKKATPQECCQQAKMIMDQCGVASIPTYTALTAWEDQQLAISGSIVPSDRVDNMLMGSPS